MLFSIAIMFLLGMFLSLICKTIKLPGLLGMILTGIILGPHALNLIDTSILEISSDLRRIALIIILTRAGLSLNINDLKKVGRPAILMCFVPASFEIIGMIILAPKLLGVSILESAIMGAVVGAVSPAVIVPKMIKLIDEGIGTKKAIPQMILAGASVDDVFVIVMFTAFTGLAKGNFSAANFLRIPSSIITGITAGLILGIIIAKIFEIFHIRDTAKILIFLSISFILVTAEDVFTGTIAFSGLIAIMCIGISLLKKREAVALRLSSKFTKLWVGAEILLFVLVGASVDLSYALNAGIYAILLLLGVLLFRMSGVFICVLGTKLNNKERLFCMLAYMPKATVQAAIGSIPLAMGLNCGDIVLTVAVLAILITAPIGSFLIDLSYKRLLQ